MNDGAYVLWHLVMQRTYTISHTIYIFPARSAPRCGLEYDLGLGPSGSLQFVIEESLPLWHFACCAFRSKPKGAKAPFVCHSNDSWRTFDVRRKVWPIKFYFLHFIWCSLPWLGSVIWLVIVSGW